MTKQEIKDVESVAVFMGAKNTLGVYDLYGTPDLNYLFEDVESDDEAAKRLFWPEEMKFATSFDWIMPVAKKSLMTKGISEEAKASICHALITCDVNEIFIAAIAFINWYNKQTNAEPIDPPIAEDLQKHLTQEERDGMAESHLSAYWSERYKGHSKEYIESDLDNHDDSLEIERAEEEIERALSDAEKAHLIQVFHDAVIDNIEFVNSDKDSAGWYDTAGTFNS